VILDTAFDEDVDNQSELYLGIIFHVQHWYWQLLLARMISRKGKIQGRLFDNYSIIQEKLIGQAGIHSLIGTAVGKWTAACTLRMLVIVFGSLLPDTDPLAVVNVFYKLPGIRLVACTCLRYTGSR